ncbi:MAG: ATP-binding protein [Acutalibacteraceae bacterium]|jgi:DNA replication protein DnaC
MGVTLAMGYDREIYDSAMAVMSDRRSTANRTARQHREEVRQKCPRALEIEREISGAGLRAARLIMTGKDAQQQIAALAEENLRQQREFAEVLREAGFAEDYMEPHFACQACRDEGYIDGRMCECLKLLLRETAQQKLNRLTPLSLSSFERFDLSYYPSEPDEKTGLSPRRKMEDIFRFCTGYAQRFSLHSPSILMTGATGLGKTHLSLAIAREVIEKGYGVIYGSAQNFMLQIERERFGRSDSSESERQLQECDLLILDDLGVEFLTQFVSAAVYNLINTRLMAERPTIISTNLSISELENRYSERVVSRIIANYRILPFIGRDVRQLKRMREAGVNYQ